MQLETFIGKIWNKRHARPCLKWIDGICQDARQLLRIPTWSTLVQTGMFVVPNRQSAIAPLVLIMGERIVIPDFKTTIQPTRSHRSFRQMLSNKGAQRGVWNFFEILTRKIFKELTYSRSQLRRLCTDWAPCSPTFIISSKRSLEKIAPLPDFLLELKVFFPFHNDL